MELKVNIGFEQLIEIVRQLPANEYAKLRYELDNKVSSGIASKSDLKAFLLKAPVFEPEQMKVIHQTRKEIDQWRVK